MVSHGAQALGAQVSVVVAHRLSWIFLIQGLNLYLLHWQANSLSLSHQGSSEQLHFWNLWTVWCYKTKADKHNIFPSCLSSVPPPAEGRSSPTNTPVFPPSSFVLLSFVWFYMFFSTGQYSCPLSAGVLQALLCLKVYNWCIHGERCTPCPPTPPPSCSLPLYVSWAFHLCGYFLFCFYCVCVCVCVYVCIYIYIYKPMHNTWVSSLINSHKANTSMWAPT